MTIEQFITNLKDNFDPFVKANLNNELSIEECEEFRKKECAKICIDYIQRYLPVAKCENNIKSWSEAAVQNNKAYVMYMFLESAKKLIDSNDNPQFK